MSVNEYIKGILQSLNKDTTDIVLKGNYSTQGEVMKYKNVKLYQRKDSNTWYARWMINSIPYRISAKTQLQAYRMLKEAYNKSQNQLPIKQYTFNEWVDEWINIYKSKNRRITIEMFRNTQKNHLSGDIFKQPIKNITSLQIQKFLVNYEETRTKKRIVGYLKDIFDKAYKNEVVAKNIMLNIDIPKYKAKERKSFTLQQEDLFIATANKVPNGIILIIELLAGLRPGEATALEWEDIDFDSKTIHVSKSISKHKDDTKLKNESSNRYVPLFDKLLKYIRKYRSSGKIYPYLQTQKSKLFREVLGLTGITGFVEDELRHTFITRCQEQNIPEHIIQKWVGHTPGSSVTKKVYTHVNTEAEEKFINIINKNS